MQALLGRIASHLQRTLIERTKTNVVHSVKGDKREWRSPAVLPAGEIAGIKLSSLTRLLYESGQVLPLFSDRIATFAYCAEQSLDHKGGVAASIFYPNLPFSGTREPNSAPLVQLLCALSWMGGRLRATKTEVTLKPFRQTGGPTIGLDQRVIMLGGRYLRLSKGATVSPTSCLTAALGQSRPGTHAMCALYRHLYVNLPDEAPQLNMLFAIALAAGPEFVGELTRMFDIVQLDVDSRFHSVWTEARRIVNTSVETPLQELSRVLQSVLPGATFTKHFGNPNRKVGLYTPILRERHSKTLDELENHDVHLVIHGKIGAQEDANRKLLKLQTMMGSYT